LEKGPKALFKERTRNGNIRGRRGYSPLRRPTKQRGWSVDCRMKKRTIGCERVGGEEERNSLANNGEKKEWVFSKSVSSNAGGKGLEIWECYKPSTS